MPAHEVECGWKPAGWHVLTLLNSRPPFLPQPPEPTFAAPPKVLPEHHELVVGRGALLNSRIPSLPRPQEPISCSVNEHVFQASRAWYRASVGQARIHTCLGAEAGATMLTNTHTHNTHRLLPPSRLISKKHTREGCAHCRRPQGKVAVGKCRGDSGFKLLPSGSTAHPPSNSALSSPRGNGLRDNSSSRPVRASVILL